MPYREKQHVLAIDTGPVVSYIQRVFLSFLSPFLPLLLSFGEPTLARFGDLLSFLPPLLTTPLRANCVFPASDSLGYYALMLAIGRGIFFPSFFFLSTLVRKVESSVFFDQRILSSSKGFAPRFDPASDRLEAIGGPSIIFTAIVSPFH